MLQVFLKIRVSDQELCEASISKGKVNFESLVIFEGLVIDVKEKWSERECARALIYVSCESSRWTCENFTPDSTGFNSLQLDLACVRGKSVVPGYHTWYQKDGDYTSTNHTVD